MIIRRAYKYRFYPNQAQRSEGARSDLPISLSASTSKLDVDQLSLLAIAAPKNAVRIAPVINAKIMGNHSITTLLVGFKTELTVAL